jgi:peptide/nickel transport system ATP-binding protein
MPPCLRVDLQAGYRGNTVLHDVRFQLERGERLGLLGTSGAGKSTLLLAILGLLSQRGGWVKGEVRIEGKNILQLGRSEARSLRGRAFALVPQSPLSALNPALTLRSQFEAAWNAHRKGDRNHLLARMTELFDRVQLPSGKGFLDRKPSHISVGQAQRCTLALALLHRPSLLIADEPTSSLDPVTQTEVITLLQEISEAEDTALLFVSHDLLSVFRLCSELAMLSGGRITEHLPLHAVPSTQDPALRELLRALPFPPELLLKGRSLQKPPNEQKLQFSAPTQDAVLMHSV